MIVIRVFAVMLLAYSSTVFAGSININLSNRAAQFEAGFSNNGNAETQAGFIYNDQGSVLIDAGLIAGSGEKEAGAGFAGGGGVKAMIGQIKQTGISKSVSGIALGGQLGYTFPAAPSLTLAGEFFTAFRITSFGDSNRFNQFGVRLEMGPPHAKFFVGYREITFSIIGSGNVSFDKGGYTGVMFSF